MCSTYFLLHERSCHRRGGGVCAKSDSSSWQLQRMTEGEKSLITPFSCLCSLKLSLYRCCCSFFMFVKETNLYNYQIWEESCTNLPAVLVIGIELFQQDFCNMSLAVTIVRLSAFENSSEGSLSKAFILQWKTHTESFPLSNEFHL